MPTTATTAHYQQPGLVHPARVQPLRRLAHPPRRERVGQPGARGARPPHRRAAPGAGEPPHLDGVDYLVSPRGHGQWVRNVRANDGRLDLLLGRRRTHHVAHELADADKVDVLRAYLRRWKLEVGQFFDGVDADSIRRGAARHRPEPPGVPPRCCRLSPPRARRHAPVGPRAARSSTPPSRSSMTRAPRRSPCGGSPTTSGCGRRRSTSTSPTRRTSRRR